jgi:hypothetical protein
MKKYIVVILWDSIYLVTFNENNIIKAILKQNFNLNYKYKFEMFRILR